MASSMEERSLHRVASVRAALTLATPVGTTEGEGREEPKSQSLRGCATAGDETENVMGRVVGVRGGELLHSKKERASNCPRPLGIGLVRAV
jgi:hypothetical protein